MYSANIYKMNLWSPCKRGIINIGVFVIYHSGLFRLINWFSNRFRIRKDKDGALLFPFIKKSMYNNIQILTYHRINDENDNFFLGLPLNIFERQIEYIADNYNILSLHNAVECLNKMNIPDNAIVVTFDDGYRDNYTNAFPILKRFAVPATIFLATEAINSRRVLWHDRVFSAFRETQILSLEGFGKIPQVYSLRSLEEKLLAQRDILEFLRSVNDYERSLYIDCLVEKLQVMDKKEVSDLMLTWDEVNIMYQNGISFGSHTVHHSILSRLQVDMVREELYESKRVIEEKLGSSITAFAYPNGREQDFNETTKNILKELGYTCALTTVFGTNESGQDLFELRRGTPWDHDIHAFGMRLHYYKFSS